MIERTTQPIPIEYVVNHPKRRSLYDDDDVQTMTFKRAVLGRRSIGVTVLIVDDSQKPGVPNRTPAGIGQAHCCSFIPMTSPELWILLVDAGGLEVISIDDKPVA